MSETSEKDRRAIASALVAAQKAWGGVASKGEFRAEGKEASDGKAAKKGFGYKYPKADDVGDAVRECLNAVGLAATEADVSDEIVRRETAWIGRFPFDLVHESGASQRYVREFPISPSEKFSFGKATKNARTECWKYWLLGLVCARGSEDDDGEEEVHPEAEKKSAPAPKTNGVPPRADKPAAQMADERIVARLRDVSSKCEFKTKEEVGYFIEGTIGRKVSSFAELTLDESMLVDAAFCKRAEERRVVASLREGGPNAPAASRAPAPSGAATASPAPTKAATPSGENQDAEPATGGAALQAAPVDCKHDPDGTGFCWRCGVNVETGEVGTPKSPPKSAPSAPTSAPTATASAAQSAAAPTSRNCATDKLLQDRMSIFQRDGKAARLEAGITDLGEWFGMINGWAGKKVAGVGTGMAMHDVDEPALRAICRGFDQWNAERKKRATAPAGAPAGAP